MIVNSSVLGQNIYRINNSGLINEVTNQLTRSVEFTTSSEDSKFR